MAAAEPRGELADARPVRADEHLRVRRPVVHADRRRGRLGRRRTTAATSSGVELARPDVRERDAERGRVGDDPVGDGQRMEAPVDRERVHRHLRPGDQLLDEHDARRARARARARTPPRARPVVRHEREPLLALEVGRLDDARVAELGGRGRRLGQARARRDSRACGTPASAKRSRWRSFDVAACAVGGSSGCGSPRRCGDAGRDRDREVDARRDDAVDALRRRRAGRSPARPRRTRSRAGRRSGSPGARGSRSTAITCRPALVRRLEQPELRRPRP